MHSRWDKPGIHVTYSLVNLFYCPFCCSWVGRPARWLCIQIRDLKPHRPSNNSGMVSSSSVARDMLLEWIWYGNTRRVFEIVNEQRNHKLIPVAEALASDRLLQTLRKSPQCNSWLGSLALSWLICPSRILHKLYDTKPRLVSCRANTGDNEIQIGPFINQFFFHSSCFLELNVISLLYDGSDNVIGEIRNKFWLGFVTKHKMELWKSFYFMSRVRDNAKDEKFWIFRQGQNICPRNLHITTHAWFNALISSDDCRTMLP